MNALRHNMEGNDGGAYYSDRVSSPHLNYDRIARELQDVWQSLEQIRKSITESEEAKKILDQTINQIVMERVHATEAYESKD